MHGDALRPWNVALSMKVHHCMPGIASTLNVTPRLIDQRLAMWICRISASTRWAIRSTSTCVNNSSFPYEKPL